jgi:hypothetical protein
MLIDDRGSMFCNKFSGKNVSSLTLMSKGEKERRVRNVSVTKESLNVECRWSNAGESSLNASVAINAKGGDCWQFQLTESKLAYTCH